MAGYLESSAHSIEHAIRRIRELESEVAAFGKLNPYTEFMEKDIRTGEQVLKVKLNKPLPPSLSGISVEAIGHLRSALDQAGFAIATATGSKGKNGQFPFGGTRQDALLRHKARSKDIPQEIFDVMMSFEPYRGGNNLLWGLNKLCNTNKHEVIVPLVSCPNGFQLKNISITGPLTVTNKWDSSKYILEVMRIGSGGKFQGNIEYSFYIAIGNIDLVSGEPAIEFLDTLAKQIQLILAAIEIEAKIIGIF